MTSRPTLDLVVLAMTATVCVVLLIVTVAITLAGAIPPNEPIAARYFDVLMTATATMLGALLGLLAGRRTGRGDAAPARSSSDDD